MSQVRAPRQSLQHEQNQTSRWSSTTQTPLSANTGEDLDPRVTAQGVARASKPKPPSRAPSDSQAKKGGRSKEEAPATTSPPETLSQPAGQANPCIGSSTQVSNLRRPTNNNLRDQEMSDPSEPLARSKSETQPEEEHPSVGGHTPNTKPLFGIPAQVGTQGRTLEANVNPFVSLGEESREAGRFSRPLVEATEGWVFQGRRRHAPILASPRLETTQSPLHTPQREATPGGKKGLMHSEVHPSFFTSLGISTPPNKESLRTKIWPMLIRKKNAKRETLVHSKNQTLSSLPLSIRITRLAKATEAE